MAPMGLPNAQNPNGIGLSSTIKSHVYLSINTLLVTMQNLATKDELIYRRKIHCNPKHGSVREKTLRSYAAGSFEKHCETRFPALFTAYVLGSSLGEVTF